jgi:hypothetical protein
LLAIISSITITPLTAIEGRSGGEGKPWEKSFFFEKKNQKTLYCFRNHGAMGAVTQGKSLFASFSSEKEAHAYFNSHCFLIID